MADIAANCQCRARSPGRQRPYSNQFGLSPGVAGWPGLRNRARGQGFPHGPAPGSPVTQAGPAGPIESKCRQSWSELIRARMSPSQPRRGPGLLRASDSAGWSRCPAAVGGSQLGKPSRWRSGARVSLGNTVARPTRTISRSQAGRVHYHDNDRGYYHTVIISDSSPKLSRPSRSASLGLAGRLVTVTVPGLTRTCRAKSSLLVAVN